MHIQKKFNLTPGPSGTLFGEEISQVYYELNNLTIFLEDTANVFNSQHKISNGFIKSIQVTDGDLVLSIDSVEQNTIYEIIVPAKIESGANILVNGVTYGTVPTTVEKDSMLTMVMDSANTCSFLNFANKNNTQQQFITLIHSIQGLREDIETFISSDPEGKAERTMIEEFIELINEYSSRLESVKNTLFLEPEEYENLGALLTSVQNLHSVIQTNTIKRFEDFEKHTMGINVSVNRDGTIANNIENILTAYSNDMQQLYSVYTNTIELKDGIKQTLNGVVNILSELVDLDNIYKRFIELYFKDTIIPIDEIYPPIVKTFPIPNRDKIIKFTTTKDSTDYGNYIVLENTIQFEKSMPFSKGDIITLSFKTNGGHTYVVENTPFNPHGNEFLVAIFNLHIITSRLKTEIFNLWEYFEDLEKYIRKINTLVNRHSVVINKLNYFQSLYSDIASDINKLDNLSLPSPQGLNTETDPLERDRVIANLTCIENSIDNMHLLLQNVGVSGDENSLLSFGSDKNIDLLDESKNVNSKIDTIFKSDIPDSYASERNLFDTLNKIQIPDNSFLDLHEINNDTFDNIIGMNEDITSTTETISTIWDNFDSISPTSKLKAIAAGTPENYQRKMFFKNEVFDEMLERDGVQFLFGETHIVAKDYQNQNTVFFNTLIPDMVEVKSGVQEYFIMKNDFYVADIIDGILVVKKCDDSDPQNILNDQLFTTTSNIPEDSRFFAYSNVVVSVDNQRVIFYTLTPNETVDVRIYSDYMDSLENNISMIQKIIMDISGDLKILYSNNMLYDGEELKEITNAVDMNEYGVYWLNDNDELVFSPHLIKISLNTPIASTSFEKYGLLDGTYKSNMDGLISKRETIK